MKYLKKYIRGEYVGVYKNFVFLAALQATNFLLPLVTLPYLLRVIGTEKFGVVTYIQAFMVFFTVITDYGFNTSATRAVALHKHDRQYLASLFSQVVTAKLLLCGLSFVLVTTLVLSIGSFRAYQEAYFLGFGIVLGQALLPVWFYQGMEEMKYLTAMNLLAKVVFTTLIFLLVKQESDYPLVLLFFGTGNLLSGIYGFVRMLRRYGLRLRLPAWAEVELQLREGWHVFLSSFCIAVYSNANIFILGFFASDLVLGYYGIADRIVNAIRQVLAVFSQAIYPFICRLASDSHASILHLLRRVYIPFLGFVFVISLGTCIFADPIIFLLADGAIPEAAHLLKILSVVPVIIALNIPVYQILLAYNLKRSYTLVITIGSILNIVLNTLLSAGFSATGTAVSVLITELFITCSLHLVLVYRHPQYALRS